MDIADLKRAVSEKEIGEEMHRLIAELYPICRSITGDGLRETLHIIQRYVPLEICEVPSGTQVFDWTVPKEWNIKDAYVADSEGEKVIDFRQSNLHVVGYSTPLNERMSLGNLKDHLFSLPDHPGWIPFRTSYYTESWGFCVNHSTYLGLKDEQYQVCIDSSLEDGYLTYGEYYLEGETTDEVLISCHACHPSLCNDNLSGVALASLLASKLGSLSLKYSYRFLFIPGTIGSITWLALNESQVSRIKHGIVLACVGDPGRTTYKRSRRGDAEIDRIVTHVLTRSGKEHEIIDFSPYGYDERQYCSPGFDLPIGCLTRTPHGEFSEYHTSADDLDFVRPECLADSFSNVVAVLDILEHNTRYVNQNPKGEPQLGKRGLYGSIGGNADARTHQLSMLWVLNLCDGQHTLLDIANRSGLDFDAIKTAADILLRHDLLTACPEES